MLRSRRGYGLILSSHSVYPAARNRGVYETVRTHTHGDYRGLLRCTCNIRRRATASLISSTFTSSLSAATPRLARASSGPPWSWCVATSANAASAAATASAASAAAAAASSVAS